jgi:hypothetical protein
MRSRQRPPRAKQAGMVGKLLHALRAALVIAATPLAPQSVLADTAPPRRGWLEEVSVGGGKLRLKAKLDTGAKTSSVTATEITELRRDGRDWVRFRIHDADEADRGHLVLERPVTRWVKIKRHSGEAARRPVVELDLCLGTTSRSVEVSLTDRSGFNYPVLLGRNFLAGTALVDAARTYTVKPRCK